VEARISHLLNLSMKRSGLPRLAAALFFCGFSLVAFGLPRSAEALDASDFGIEVTDATVDGVNQIFPRPAVAITSIAPAGGASFDVTVDLTDAVTLGSLQVEIDYSAANGEFAGEFTAVECDAPLAALGAIVSINDNEPAEILGIAIIKFGGFAGPVELATCRFESNSTTTLPPMTTTTLDVTTTTLDEMTTTTLDGTTTTTSTTTTVSIPPSSTTTVSTTSTSLLPLEPPFDCDVTFGVVDDSVLGTLTYDVDYSGNVGGSFDGEGGNVQCEAGSGLLASFNHDAAAEFLTSVFVSGDPIEGPRDLAVCAFSSPENLPAKSAFEVTITEQTTPDFFPIQSEVAATRMVCNGVVVTTCGDGVVEPPEQCDQGDRNSDTRPNRCRTNCRTAYCGDGVIDNGEECDDGNRQSGDLCTRQCRVAAVCGDADFDGEIDATDALILLNAAVGLVEDCPIDRCDVTGDGRVTATDAQAVLAAAIGLPVALVCEALPAGP
jgi:cysteine-rich repeat protein